ncbi:hypothetical protein BKA93DRAFT_27673 [Sparassis latifolia]
MACLKFLDIDIFCAILTTVFLAVCHHLIFLGMTGSTFTPLSLNVWYTLAQYVAAFEFLSELVYQGHILCLQLFRAARNRDQVDSINRSSE